MLITRDDIQRVGDEDSLLHFLEEKLNLPIPEGSALEDITIKFGKLALGLTGAVANQVLDCQELIVSPGQPSGIFLIRFNSESGYTETLRTFAGNLGKPGHNPADLRFICMNEYFQPFAFAYFNDSESKDWQTAVLNIRAWTQENTHIHTSSEHELPTEFFANEPLGDIDDESDIFNAELPVHTASNANSSQTKETVNSEASDDVEIFDKSLNAREEEPEKHAVEPVSPDVLPARSSNTHPQVITPSTNLTKDERTIFDAIGSPSSHIDNIVRITQLPINKVSSLLLTLELKGAIQQLAGKQFAKVIESESKQFTESSEDHSNLPVYQMVELTSSGELLTGLENRGVPLRQQWEIYSGPSIQPGCSEALVLDKFKHQQLITNDPKSSELIKPVVRMPRESKWKPERRHLIWITSSEFVQWPWSNTNSETNAEMIFSDAYPAISKHLFDYRDKLKSSTANNQGKFYWETPTRIPTREQYPRFYQPKVVYPADGVSLGAGYDTSESLILGRWTVFIPTTDLSLLAILNSKLFDWYAKTKYQAKYKSKVPRNWLTFKKANMENFPVANRTQAQKTDLSNLVEMILGAHETLEICEVPDFEAEVFDDELPEIDEEMGETPLSKAFRLAAQAPFEPEIVTTSDAPQEDLDREILGEVYEVEREIDQLVYELYELTPAEIALIEEGTNK